MKIFNKGFNYSQDGPGNRLVYHLQGCNFKCKWCSNPESMDTKKDSTAITIDEMVKEAKSCMPMFFDGGGVTLTGGEPTIQFDEVKELLEKLKAEGIHTAMETNGSHPKLADLFSLIDFLIMDIKHYDKEKHIYWTGFSNENTINNFKKICEEKNQALIRIPLINGVNDDAQGFADLFKSYDCTKVSFEILPYHEYGKDKWQTPYEMKNAFISSERVKEFKNIFIKNGLNIIST